MTLDQGWTAATCLTEKYPEISDEEAQVFIDWAEWALGTLTFGKYHGPECWLEELEIRGCDLRFPRGPVDTIHLVEKVDGCGQNPVPIEDWCWSGPQSINVCGGTGVGGWGDLDYRTNPWMRCGRPDRLRVTYSIESNLPPGSAAAVCRMADEYYKAATGDKTCALPERIQTVTRQGVSWTILDPQTFLTQGLVGIAPIDHWLTIARLAAGTATLTDPLRGRVISSTQLDCATIPEPAMV